MDKVYERKVKYVEVPDGNGNFATHLVFEYMGRFSKKKPLGVKHSTKNVNGKVITTITYEKQ